MKFGFKRNNDTLKSEAMIDSASTNISESTKNAFIKWLSLGNSKDYSPSHIVACFDRVSEYAVDEKIIFYDLWSIRKHNVFKQVYKTLLNKKMLRIKNKDTYRLFNIAGRLYLKFLKEKPFTADSFISEITESNRNIKKINSVVDEYNEDSENVEKNVVDSTIDPESVIAWLIMQPNAAGTLYLESVARQYMRALRSTTSKFELSNSVPIDRNVFAHKTSRELIEFWNTLKNTPNYKQINRSTSGMFSAGMSCYLKYLEHLEKSDTLNANFNQCEKNWSIDIIHEDVTNVYLSNCDEETIVAIDFILTKKFSNGFRYSNDIEISRLRRLVREQLGTELMLSDAEIIKYALLHGTEYNGKVYIISKDTKEHIYRLVEDYFRHGAVAIFYSEFYIKHESFLFESSIVSEEILTGFLRANFKGYYFTQTYFGNTNDSVYNVLQNEILRVWDNEILLTYEALSERLIYIPQYRIEQHLGQNNDFIWNAKGEFTHVSKINITKYEKHEITNYIESEIRIHDYASISNVPLNEIIDRNYMLSISAIHNAIHLICLADKYSKLGKIINRKGEKINALYIMKEYCKTLDRCMLDELLNYERNLTGECHRWIPMQAGYDVLVRIDKNTFIAERYINFDTYKIDTAIEYFLHGGEYIPLQSVTTFAMFPHCGQAWNLFLLESYCRRFSDDFRFECLSVNSKNAGAIVRKKSQLSYADMITDAVAKSNIPLAVQPVLNFLVESGYISTCRYTKVAELINQAKAIRNKQEGSL